MLCVQDDLKRLAFLEVMVPRQLNLRQIEAFKAVIENGTVSRAAELLNMSQPAMSKLIALEDAGGTAVTARESREMEDIRSKLVARIAELKRN